jgi:hypothetical protein
MGRCGPSLAYIFRVPKSVTASGSGPQIVTPAPKFVPGSVTSLQGNLAKSAMSLVGMPYAADIAGLRQDTVRVILSRHIIIYSLVMAQVFLSGDVLLRKNQNKTDLFAGMKAALKSNKYQVFINGGKYTDRPESPESINTRPAGIDIPPERVVVFSDPSDRRSAYRNKLYFYPIAYKARILSMLTLAQDCTSCESPFYYGETGEYLMIVNECWMYCPGNLDHTDYGLSIRKYVSEFK